MPANRMAKRNNQKQTNKSGLNFETQLWATADKMHGHMDASGYKLAYGSRKLAALLPKLLSGELRVPAK